MKKLFFPVMLLAAAFVSCSEDEPSIDNVTNATTNGEGLVSINVYAGTTKGTDTTTDTLESDTYVELHIDDSGSVQQSYTFVFKDKDWSQSEDDPIKWSEIVFPANFYSMHDGDAFTGLSFTEDVATYTDYTVSGDSSAHKDLTFHASQLVSIPTGGVLSAYHKHALSKIHLYASTGTNKVYIAKATLINVDGTGTVTITPLTTAEEEAGDVGASWKSTSDYSDYNYYYIGAEETAAATAIQSSSSTTNSIINTNDDAPLMIIPQSTTGITADEIRSASLTVKSYIEVIYYLTTAADNPLVGYSSVSLRGDASDYIDADQEKTLYVKAAFPLTYEFEPNKEYDIKLGLGAVDTTGGKLVDDFYVDKNGDPVTLTKVDCDDDDEDKEDDVDITDIDEGDDILDNLNSEIDITVSVNEWDDGDTHVIE